MNILNFLWQLVLLVFGFVLLIKGADFFVEGASKIADRFHIPQIIIGLTIVAFGTSAPEAAISITAALNHNADITIGNVVGSNILNVLIILGITSCIVPLVVQTSTLRYEIPFLIVVTAVFFVLGYIGGEMTFIDGIILWIFFLIFFGYLLVQAKKGQAIIEEGEKASTSDRMLKLILITLAGLVAITAGCDLVSPVGAFCIGIIASFVVVFGIEFVDKKLKIDDPVGAVGVHGLCGATGTILTGLFALDDGLLYGHGFKFLGVQCLGVIAVIAWVAVTMTIVFTVIKKTIGLRVTREEEIEGLDKQEHGLESSYADFMPVEASAAVPVIDMSTPVEVSADTGKKEVDGLLRKVVVVTNQSKFESLKLALENIGVTGMTVIKAHGCGMQKGNLEYYRGVEVEMQLLPKIKVEIVIAEVPLDLVVKTIRKVLYSGNIGDGKIFVYTIDNAIKIRTGEEGYDAIK